MPTRFVSFLAVAIALSLAGSLLAVAADCLPEMIYFGVMSSQEPMTFSVTKITGFDRYPDLDPKSPGAAAVGGISFDAIVANGRIADGTTDRFTRFLQLNPLPKGTLVYLSSPGGLLVEGMHLGNAIREHQFDTIIGSVPLHGTELLAKTMSSGPVEVLTHCSSLDDFKMRLECSKLAFNGLPPSAGCISACTFAFLGGVEREIDSDSLYGVHRFFTKNPIEASVAIRQTQLQTVELLHYVRTMGVDPGLLEEMVKAGNDESDPKRHVNNLPTETLKALHVITATHPKRSGSPSGC